MSDRPGHLRPPGPARGGLRGERPDGDLAGDRALPPPSLAPFVHHLWTVRWDLRRPFLGETLPHPSAQIVFQQGEGLGRAELLGVCTGRLSRRLSGAGRVFGVTFRPATFGPLLGAPMSTITDRVLPLGQLLGGEGEAWAGAVLAAASFDEQIGLAEAFLAPRLGALEGEAERLRDVVERLSVDRSIERVEHLARGLGVDVRSLQRGFRRHVGASPKWVLRRYRMHEAAEQLKGPKPPSLAALAASLGYSDQAHFARDFKLATGLTPGAFCGARPG